MGDPVVINAADLGKLGSLRQPHHDLVIEWVGVDEITPHPRNARRGDLEKIKTSIEKNGMYDAVKVQRSTGHIIVGNHRYKAAVELGMTIIPVSYLNVDDEKALAILLVDNKSSDDAEYDLPELYDLLTDMAELEGTGWTEDELKELERTLNPDDDEDDDESPDALGGDGLGVVLLAVDKEDQQQIIDELIAHGYRPMRTTVSAKVKGGDD